MLKTQKFIGILAFLAIFGLVFWGCDDGGTELNIVTFTVTFNSNGGSAVPYQNIPGGEKAVKPKNVSQQVNYALEGWYTDNNTFENKWDFDINIVTGDITLYAKWQEVDPIDYEDFGPLLLTATYTAANAAQWYNAVEAIKNGGNDKNYVIYITGDFAIKGSYSENWSREYGYKGYKNTFGDVSDIIVSLRSEGKTITLIGDENWYNILNIGNNQSLVTRNVNLKCTQVQDAVLGLVFINEGNYVMRGGEISSNDFLGEYVYAGVIIGAGSFTMYSGKVNNNFNGVEIHLGNFIMHDGEISNNYYNGVMSGNSTFTMNNGKITNNRSGVSISNGGTFMMYNGQISGNQDSGVIVHPSSNNASFTMIGGVISGNTASWNGGGVSISNGIFTMNGGTITGNSGGGVYVTNYNDEVIFTMNGGTITGNSGGGVYVDGSYDEDNNTFFTMNGGTISGNIADYGGGVYCNNSIFTMNGGTISNNTASSGGGVCVEANLAGEEINAIFTMNGGTISGNIVDYDGGGVSSSSRGALFIMEGGIISGNTANSGGGVFAYNFSMNGGTIIGNTANSGGGVYIYYGSFTLTNGIIYGINEGENSNIASGGAPSGHAVYAVFYRDNVYFSAYRNTTIFSYISTSGETFNGWTK